MTRKIPKRKFTAKQLALKIQRTWPELGTALVAELSCRLMRDMPAAVRLKDISNGPDGPWMVNAMHDLACLLRYAMSALDKEDRYLVKPLADYLRAYKDAENRRDRDDDTRMIRINLDMNEIGSRN